METKIILTVNTLSRAEMEKSLLARVVQLNAVVAIENDEVRDFAYETVTKARKDVKNVETERKKITRLFDDEKKKYMELEKSMVSSVYQESERVAGLVSRYDKLIIEEANREAQRYNQQVQEQRDKQAAQQAELSEAFGETETMYQSSVFIDAVALPQGALPKGTTETRQYRVVDFSKVPDLFKTIDEAKVRQAMKDGSEVYGIEFFTEQKTTFR